MAEKYETYHKKHLAQKIKKGVQNWCQNDVGLVIITDFIVRLKKEKHKNRVGCACAWDKCVEWCVVDVEKDSFIQKVRSMTSFIEEMHCVQLQVMIISEANL